MPNVVGLVLLLVLVPTILHVLGKRLPDGHVITAKMRLEKPVGEVWKAISDTAGIPSWDKGVDRVERLPDRDGHEVWRWHMGRNRMVLEITVSDPEKRLVRNIADEAKFFSGDWTYELAAEGGGCVLNLTEHGRVHVAIPRAMMRYLPFIADPSLYLRRHLTRLAEKFGEPPRIEAGEYKIVDPCKAPSERTR